MPSDIDDAVVLVARLLLSALFVIFGWRKLKDVRGTVTQMTDLHVPLPRLAAAVATFMELGVASTVAAGLCARTAALLLFLYTFGTALIGHHYWTVAPPARIDSMDGFYKNLSIMGGLLLLHTTGAGKYSIDGLLNIAAP